MKKLNPLMIPSPRGPRDIPKRRKGGRFTRFVLTLACIALGVYAYAWLRSPDPVGYLRSIFHTFESSGSNAQQPSAATDPSAPPSSQQNNVSVLTSGPRAPQPPAQPSQPATQPAVSRAAATPSSAAATPAAVATPPKRPRQPAAAPTSVAHRYASQLREIDTLTANKDYASAKEKLHAFVASCDAPDYASQAIYRAGLIGRLEKNEADARKHWADAYEKYPKTVGGRLSALALADSYFVEATQTPPQYDKWEAIRNIYSDAMGMDGARFLPPAVKQRVAGNLDYLNRRLVFSSAPVTGALFHTVKAGDYLSEIAKKYDVHYDSIISINHVNPRAIRRGMKLKILKSSCTIVVDKTDLTCTMYLDGRWAKQYRCCVGPANKTPPGRYTLEIKDANPTWTDPADGKVYRFGDPKNIIGTRWMSLKGGDTEGLGIHGTTLEESIPGRTSNGCVRLRNKDVEELYGFALIGSTVIILP